MGLNRRLRIVMTGGKSTVHVLVPRDSVDVYTGWPVFKSSKVLGGV